MIWDILAGILSGALGAMGFGGGGVLILYLTLYKNIPQLEAQGINLIFFIPSAILALFFHTKNKLIDWKISLQCIIWGLIGLSIGYYLLKIIDEKYITKIFSIILITVGIKDLIINIKSKNGLNSSTRN